MVSKILCQYMFYKTLTKMKGYYFEPVTSEVCWQIKHNDLWVASNEI